VLVRLIREVVDEARDGSPAPTDAATIAARVVARLDRLVAPHPVPAINATGVILHTNLGRAPLGSAIRSAMEDAAGYTDLEISRMTGKRASRTEAIAAQLRPLLGAEAAMVVGNNAAAILLTLAGLAADKQVLTSRGEAVEIGDGFRILDIARQARARIVEVGATNRTSVEDYVGAVTERTAAILHVHRSNFSVVGFADSVPIQRLSLVARRHGLRLIVDNGSGAMVDTERFGIAHEPTPAEALAGGADVVTFSTDKLLGGPQGGVIAGKREVVSKLARLPLARALRPDKTILAGLHATLAHYLEGKPERMPVIAMLALTPEVLQKRASMVAERLRSAGIVVQIMDTEATVGGGSLPGQTLPSVALALATQQPAEALSRCLRMQEPPVIGRIERGRVLLDLRTVSEEQLPLLAASVLAATTSGTLPTTSTL